MTKQTYQKPRGAHSMLHVLDHLKILKASVIVTQLCLTLCDPLDCSLPDSSVHGIPQARILEWVAILFSRGSSRSRDQTQVSCIADSLPSEPPGMPMASINIFRSTFTLLKHRFVKKNHLGHCISLRFPPLSSEYSQDQGNCL